jgi:hypothetical protein
MGTSYLSHWYQEGTLLLLIGCSCATTSAGSSYRSGNNIWNFKPDDAGRYLQRLCYARSPESLATFLQG